MPSAEASASSGVARSELFITTKLRGSDMAADATRAALERSLAALGTEYVDLYLIHWPLPGWGSLRTPSSPWRSSPPKG